jgi:hypothetical protein
VHSLRFAVAESFRREQPADRAASPETSHAAALKIETSGRALPEVSEVYQKAAKEFHWLP